MSQSREHEHVHDRSDAGAQGDCCGEKGCGCAPHGAPADTPESVEPLRQENEELRAQLGKAQDQYLRALAEYQNFQRRSLNNEREAKVQGASDVVRSMVPVLDHFALALLADPEKASTQSIVAGVAAIRDEMLKALAQHGVQVIGASPDDEFVPGRHEAVMRVPASPGSAAQPGRIAALLQPGYMLGDRVLRPAKVSVMATNE